MYIVCIYIYNISWYYIYTHIYIWQQAALWSTNTSNISNIPNIPNISNISNSKVSTSAGAKWSGPGLLQVLWVEAPPGRDRVREGGKRSSSAEQQVQKDLLEDHEEWSRWRSCEKPVEPCGANTWTRKSREITCGLDYTSVRPCVKGVRLGVAVV